MCGSSRSSPSLSGNHVENSGDIRQFDLDPILRNGIKIRIVNEFVSCREYVDGNGQKHDATPDDSIISSNIFSNLNHTGARVDYRGPSMNDNQFEFLSDEVV